MSRQGTNWFLPWPWSDILLRAHGPKIPPPTPHTPSSPRTIRDGPWPACAACAHHSIACRRSPQSHSALPTQCWAAGSPASAAIPYHLPAARCAFSAGPRPADSALARAGVEVGGSRAGRLSRAAARAGSGWVPWRPPLASLREQRQQKQEDLFELQRRGMDRYRNKQSREEQLQPSAITSNDKPQAPAVLVVMKAGLHRPPTPTCALPCPGPVQAPLLCVGCLCPLPV